MLTGWVLVLALTLHRTLLREKKRERCIQLDVSVLPEDNSETLKEFVAGP